MPVVPGVQEAEEGESHKSMNARPVKAKLANPVSNK